MSPLCCNNSFMGYQWTSPFTHKHIASSCFFLLRLGDSKGGPLPLVFHKFVGPQKHPDLDDSGSSKTWSCKKLTYLTSSDLARKDWGLRHSPKKKKLETLHLPTVLAVFTTDQTLRKGSLLSPKRWRNTVEPPGWRTPWGGSHCAKRHGDGTLSEYAQTGLLDLFETAVVCFFGAVCWFYIYAKIIFREAGSWRFFLSSRDKISKFICFNFLAPREKVEYLRLRVNNWCGWWWWWWWCCSRVHAME